MNRFWWSKFFYWVYTGRWDDLICNPCERGIHMHDDTKTKRCITKGCDCYTEEG